MTGPLFIFSINCVIYRVPLFILEELSLTTILFQCLILRACCPQLSDEQTQLRIWN